ncbi:hypothetical protein WR164_14980 [Philodulcilactobacillus myokoensis]|uniref:Uncharacterized protein n=1 Tax=Philodulcilactobacillus myokoensis TaxID=2929573 RepID=A0A9W6B4T1_9LACO|nr:hypothetical protein [Philodulcilactobacillus myokoensis]GLB47519.1 hypothetical protein WR164_14980 [Philodulcilactobacillus myokoensis]
MKSSNVPNRYKDQADLIKAMFLENRKHVPGVRIDEDDMRITFAFTNREDCDLSNVHSNVLDLLSIVGDLAIKFEMSGEYDNQHKFVELQVIDDRMDVLPNMQPPKDATITHLKIEKNKKH